MKNYLFQQFRLLGILAITLTITACNLTSQTDETPALETVPSDTEESQSGASGETPPLREDELSDVSKLIMQRTRANEEDQQMALDLLESGNGASAQARQDGPGSDFVDNGGWSIALKAYCGSSIIYPTTDSLLGCAESKVMADTVFETKLKRFEDSLPIYETLLESSAEIDRALEPSEVQVIEGNVECLDSFLKAPDPDTPGCSLIEESLKIT